MAGLLDLISARNPGEARQTLADLVRGPQNRLRGLLDSPVSAGSGTSNYVVFDDSLLKILERNGMPVP